MQSDSSTRGVAARWRNIRRLYPIYLAISQSFQVGSRPPYASIAGVTEEQEPEAIEHAERWLAAMDAHILPHHLRQTMQQSDVAATEPRLLALVQRHASKGNRSQLDSDKLNFVMTQYLWVCAPPSFRSREISVLDAAEVLEPVLGQAPSDFAPWLKPLQEALEQLRACNSVTELKEGGFVERGRELRSQLGPRYFERSSLLLFAYYNFCLRQAFVRSIAADARRIQDGIDHLRKAGYQAPIRLANHPSPMTIDEVQQRATEITSLASGEYGVDEGWKQIPEVRAAVERAVADSRSSAIHLTDDRVAQLGDRLQMLLEQIESVRNDLAALREAGFAKSAPPQAASPRAAAPQSDFDLPLDVAVADVPQAPAAPQSIPAASAAAEVESPRAEPAPEPPPAAPAPQASSDGDSAAVVAEMEKQLTHLRAVLSSAKATTGLIPVGNTAIVLSAAEIDAVMNGTGKPAELIRQGIAARMSLVEKLDLARTGQQQDFDAMQKAASDLQSTIHTLLKGGNRPPSDALSTTSRQLAAVLRAVPRK